MSYLSLRQSGQKREWSVQKMKSRNFSIDIFRAIAIVLITGYHILRFIDNPAKPVYLWDFYAPFRKGNVGISLFVFISGYVTHWTSSQLPWPDFIKKKLWRIVIPYYTALLVWNLLMFFGVLNGGTHNLIDNVTHLLFIHNLYPKTFWSISGVFWYLGMQVQLYIVYLLLKGFIGKHSLIIGIASLAVCLTINILPAFIIPHSTWLPVIINSIFSYSFIFFMAVIIREHSDRVVPYLRKPYNFYCLVAVAILWLFLQNQLFDYGELERMSIALLLGLIMLGMPTITENNFIWKPLITIGTSAYSIYLYNYIFYTFSPRLLAIRGLIIYSTITIFFGIAAFYLVEEPLKRFIFLKEMGRASRNSSKPI